MKHTLHFILSFTLLLSGILSFAGKKTNDNFACPTATISYVGTPFCASDTSTQAVTLTGTDAYLGGVFMSTSGLTLNSATGAIIPNTSTPGAYIVTYTIAADGSCPAVNATTSITVLPSNTVSSPSSTPTVCVNTSLMPITHTTTGATGIGTVTGLPPGVTATWSGNTITISGAPTTEGVFNYTVPSTGGCQSTYATGTITVLPSNSVSSASSYPTICLGAPISPPITHTTTGATGISSTGLPTGVTATWSGNTISITGTPTTAIGSPFNYTISLTGGCGTANATGTITVTMASNAGTDGNISICESSSTINLFDIISGEDSGGTWTRTSGSGGTFNAAAGTYTSAVGATSSSFSYTVIGTSPCSNDTSMAIININPAPTGITISGGTTTCAGIPVNLTVTGTPGTVITMTDGGPQNTLIIGASGATTIVVSPTVTTTYTLTNASLNGCSIPFNQSTTVTVNQTPQFINQIPDITICNGEILNIASQLTSTAPGTNFTWAASTFNVNIAAISGDETNIDQLVNLINPAQNGTITIEVMPHVGSCSGTSQQILIIVNPIPAITSTIANQTTICNNEVVTITTVNSSSATAYYWQVINANNVQIVGGVTSGTSATGIFNAQLALINSSVAGTISFEITPVNGICIGTPIFSDTITVNPTPGTPIGLPAFNMCSGETLGLYIDDYPNVAGTLFEWEIIPSANVTVNIVTPSGSSQMAFIQDVLFNTSNTPGQVTYSVTTKLGDCEGGTTNYVINVLPLPNPVLTDGSICVDATTGVPYQSYILDTQISNLNLDFNFDWFLLNTTTNMFDQIAGASASTYETTVAGSYQVIVTNIVTNCMNQASAYITETIPATGISTTVSNSTITVTVDPIGTGNLIYALDNGDWQESNVFTGVEAGTHTVLVSDLEGCTNLSTVVAVNEVLTDLVTYPNPAFDSLSFNNKNKVMSVQISNQLGQVVLTKDINLKNGSIDLSELNMGIYNVVFETETETITQKIIKQ